MTHPAAPRPIDIRPIREADQGELARFYARLSPESFATRFHAAGHGIRDGAVRTFCGPDHEHREGLVAEARDESGMPSIVGHVCLEPIDDDEAEVAVAVADAWQRRGVGRAMLADSIRWSRAHGIRRLRASVLWGNGPMLGLLRATGLPLSFGQVDCGVTEVRVDLGETVRRAA
jgi:acetyltransferase